MNAPHNTVLLRMRDSGTKFLLSPSGKSLYVVPHDNYSFLPHYQTVAALKQVADSIARVKVYLYAPDWDTDRSLRNFSVANGFVDCDLSNGRDWHLDIPYGVLYKPESHYLFRLRRTGLEDLVQNKIRFNYDVGLRITYGGVGERRNTKAPRKLQFANAP